MQLKYSNYVAFSHFHGKAVNNSGLIISYSSGLVNIIYNFFVQTLCFLYLLHTFFVLRKNVALLFM